MSADMFLKKWNERYKNETWNKSGCYVILIYSHAIKEFHKEKYEAIYIGQSLHLANRVKQHLQGNGNKNEIFAHESGVGKIIPASLFLQLGVNENEI